ncbi:LOW QUALITY PROTEIN: interferon-inducible GTPase 5-like [Syngnathus scovelli]|uniref:LOW QUALITY PROTEIN: interferon-inducible GTPase 5-like n=1 Tax=Syngnathus scovelli TaxID=161590 RepID=UPI00211032BB|nr:LOW QUALITY PROTEIN: interferon-inducible GTPase 5-like [Syngnathus scovelli]
MYRVFLNRLSFFGLRGSASRTDTRKQLQNQLLRCDAMVDVLKGVNLLESLKNSTELTRLSAIKDAVEDLLISRLNLAVIGQRSEEKRAFTDSLLGVSAGDQGAACSSTAAAEDLRCYPNPVHPDFRLWDLPPVPAVSPFEPDLYMDAVKFLRYNVVFLTFTRTPPPSVAALLLRASSLRLQTLYLTLLVCGKEEDLESTRKDSIEALKALGVTQPKVYLVSPSALEALDFPALLEDLAKDLPEIRWYALLMALPTLTAALVTQKKEAFGALAWVAASLSAGISAVPVPLVASAVDSSLAVRVLCKAQASLCLDDASVERLARRRGREPARLKALRVCPLSAQVTKAEVRRRLAAATAEKDCSALSSRLVQMAMPRHARSAGRSFAAMLHALNGAIADMAADAENVLASALA